MNRNFVNREEELKFLEEKFKSKKFECVIVYGRRRVGKTTLIKKFIEGKNVIYLLCENVPIRKNLENFSKELEKITGFPIKIENLKDLFKVLSKTNKDVIVIDEISYMIKQSEDVLAELQTVLDEIMKDKKVLLILCGSSVSLMQRDFFSYSSPIYGRISGAINLKPLKFFDLKKWFEKSSFEEIFKIYSTVDGIPRYLEFFSGKNVEEEIIQNFFNKNAFLFREMYQLLIEELRNPAVYFAILEAISKGKNKVTEIANYVYMKPADISSYLLVLQNLGLIKRIYSVTEKKVKKVMYIFSENYTRFWFYFISDYFEEIDSGFYENALNFFRKNFNTYLGKTFEDVVLELLRFKLRIIPFTKIGKWWHKDKEIDIVALNEQTKEILFCECKWKDKVDAEKICKELVEKIQYVNWYNNERKEYFAIFAKSFSKKIEEFEGKKVFCFDLKDLEKYVNRGNKNI